MQLVPLRRGRGDCRGGRAREGAGAQREVRGGALHVESS
jgi:hypothetical protein